MKQYIIQTPRLGLRQWLPSDKSPFAEMNSNPAVMQHFPKILSVSESNELYELLKTHFETYGFTYFAVDELSSGNFIGFIGMKHQTYEAPFTPAIDIGWRLAPRYWGKGYATEGANACMERAYEQFGIARIVSVCTHTNTASERVMIKLGMKKEMEFEHPKLNAHPQLNPCLVYSVALP